MSSRASGSRGGAANDGQATAARASSQNRFADRRQERMRGAGTAVAMQRDFRFQLPPKRAGPATTSAANADASTSANSSLTKRRPGRPRGSGPKQRAAAAAAAAAAAEGSFDDAGDLDAFSPPPLSHDGGLPYSPRMDASGSMGVGRRMERPRTSAPISSTPAASRILKQGQPRTASAVAASPRAAEEEYEEIDSQLGDSYSGSGGSGNGAGMMDGSPGWDGGAHDMDESLPMIPSPAASSSHVDSSVRRMRPSIGGASASHLSIASHADSPAARAAQRNLDARQRRRQGSAGVDRLAKQASAAPRRGRPPKTAASAAAASTQRALFQIPTELDDETVMDRTMVDRQRRGATVGRPSGREMQKRLKRALSLVFSASEAADPDDPDSSQPSKKRKSAKYLNDIDIIWSIVDDELRSAIEEQPAKAPFLALKALRKSVRSNFLNLSEKTDNRTTLISQLMRARKQKRLLRKEVFAKRSQLAKVTVEVGERQKELDDWAREVGEVRRCNSFLLNLRHQSATWA